MDLVKKNLVFFVIVGVAAVAFVAGAVLAFLELGAVSDASKKVSREESQLKAVLGSSVAPTAENVAASSANVEELTAELQKIRSDLEKGAKLTASDDSISVMASIQQFIAAYRNSAKDHTDVDGEAASISIPVDFAFGFDEFVDETSVSDSSAETMIIDQQRQVLDFVIGKLFASDPQAIESVEREAPSVVLSDRDIAEEVDESKPRLRKSSANADQGFHLKPPVSAKVPGAINTLGFSVSFTGYTQTLRTFINELAKFELPIVVRSIEVDRPTDATTTAAVNSGANDLDAVFGLFGGDSAAVTEEIQQKPVVEDTVSTFTVTFEFIEIVLPEMEEEEEA